MSQPWLPAAVFVGSAFLSATSTSTFAQTAGSAGLEEVIVTARKTEESQQSVPVSITALSPDALDKAAVLDVQDLRSSVPGLFVATNSQGGAPTFAIRAAKADNGTSDTVTAYIGDMPVASTRAVANMVYDMQSISVLKGPQGTLFGANSTGGAIIFRPNMPSGEFEGYAEVGMGNFDRQSFQGMINLPVSEVVQIRLAGEVVDRDEGFQKNHTPGGPSDMGTDKHESARLGIRIKPGDAWEHNFTFDYFHEDDQPYQDSPGALRSRYNYRTFLNGLQVPVDYALAGGTIVGDPRNVTIGGSPTFNKADIWDGVYTLQYEFNDQVSFKNVVGYQDISLDTFQDNDSTPYQGVNQHTKHDIKQWTVEPSIDFKSADGRFRNKTGLFYSDKKQDTGNSSTVVGLPWDFTAFGPVPNTVSNTIPNFYPIQSNAFYNRKFESRAIYTQFSYDLSSELTATLGLRYTWDEGDYRARNQTGLGVARVAANQGLFAVTGGTCSANLATYPSYDAAACRAGASLKSSASSFNFTLEDQFSDASMVYATVRGGYLVGGFNNNVNPATTGVPHVFDPEKVTDFEVGLKSDWSIYDHPIRTNVAAFYGNYKNQQRVQNGTTAAGTTFIGVVNAGASTFYGLDLDVTYEVTNNLELRAGWNHIVSEYTKFDAIVNIPGKFAFVDLTDEPMSQTPKDVVNASATLKWPLPQSVGDVSSTLGYFWSAKTTHHDSPTFNCNTNASGECISVVPGEDFTEFDKLPSYDLWNFTTSWDNVLQSNFDVDVWVKNLTDEEYVTYGSNQMLQFGYASFTYGHPREYGVNVRYSF